MKSFCFLFLCHVSKKKILHKTHPHDSPQYGWFTFFGIIPSLRKYCQRVKESHRQRINPWWVCRYGSRGGVITTTPSNFFFYCSKLCFVQSQVCPEPLSPHLWELWTKFYVVANIDAVRMGQGRLKKKLLCWRNGITWRDGGGFKVLKSFPTHYARFFYCMVKALCLGFLEGALCFIN